MIAATLIDCPGVTSLLAIPVVLTVAYLMRRPLVRMAERFDAAHAELPDEEDDL